MEKPGEGDDLKEVSLLIFFFPYAWCNLLCLLFKFSLLSCLQEKTFRLPLQK